MKSRLLIPIAAAFLFLTLIPMTGFANDSIPQERVVLLVYDDSGSMMQKYTVDQNGNGQYLPLENWKYANYALQSLVALLDENDQMYVTKMSDPGSIDQIMLDQPQTEMEQIRSWDVSGDTPFQAIRTSFNSLEELTDENPKAEYWVIVLTDGVVNEMVESYDEYDNQEEYIEGVQNVEDTLQEYKTTILEQEDIEINPNLITIESDLEQADLDKLNEFKAMWDRTIGGITLTANSKEAIVSRINEVAALITNRDPNETNEIMLDPTFQENQIILDSPLPLRRIMILEQSTNNTTPLEIDQIEVNNSRDTYELSDPLLMQTPEEDNDDDPSIRGYITRINGPDHEVIPPGEYKITYDEVIDVEREEDFQFYAEPAIDFGISFYRLNEDGTQTDDQSLFFAESDMSIEVELVTSDDKRTPIDLDGVDQGLFEVTARIDGETMNLTWDQDKQRFTGEFVLQEQEEIPVTVTTRIKGYYQQDKTTTLEGYPIRNLAIEPTDKNWEKKIDELEDDEAIGLIPIIDNEEISEAELKEIMDQFHFDVEGKKIDFEIRQDGNTILLDPEYNMFIWFTSTGDIPIHAELEGKYPKEFAELDFTVTIHDIPFWKKWGPPIVIVLAILLLLIYIVMVIKNPRFKKGAYIAVQRNILDHGEEIPLTDQPETRKLKGNKWKTLIPRSPEQKVVDQFLFFAGKNDNYIYLSKKSQTPHTYVNGEKLGDESGKRDIEILNQTDIKMINEHSYETIVLKYYKK